MPRSRIHSVSPWIGCPDGGQLRVAIVQQPALEAGPDEYFLLIEHHAGSATRPRELLVELYRGDARRDVWSETILADQPQPNLLMRRIALSGVAGRSSRLHCRVFLDGREVARPSLLLTAVAVDAQGRLPQPVAETPMSDATVLVYGNALNRLLRPRDP